MGAIRRIDEAELITVTSRFRVRNGMEAEVRAAFLNRPRLVEKTSGFCGLEVHTDAADPAVFFLITRWRDETSFRAWHRSDGHHQSHSFMPPGLKLDAAFTLLTIANNLEDPAGVKNLADAVETETTAISQWLLESDSVFALLLGPDGTIRARNRAARRIFPDSAEEKTETSIWDYLVCADTTDLRRRLLDFTETIKAPFLLNLTDGQQNQMTAEVTIIPCRGASVMIGAQEHQHDARFQNESFKLTDHLALMMRDASQKNRELNATNAKVTELSQTDGLTGLANRRSLDEAMLREVARAARTGKSLSVILADLDHFKSINDNFGHNTGDQVLIRAAAVFGTSLRPYDLAARYGGEEFLLLLPGATSEAASAISDRIRNEISKLIIPGCLQPITASFGVASWAGGETPGALIARADAALYVAKNAGRNRVEVAAGVEA